jgi:hypothetical protein
MPRAINKLSAILVSRRTLKPGHHSDGGGLYLQVSESVRRAGARRSLREAPAADDSLGEVLRETSDARPSSEAEASAVRYKVDPAG